MKPVEPSALPSDVVTPATGRDVIAMIGGVLLVVLLLNGAVLWYLQAWSPNVGYRLISAKWKLLLGLERPVEWLVLGDSTGNQGVVPAVLRERLGVRAVNLCTIASLLAVGDVWMLETYIHRHGSPRAVLIVHAYDMWERDLDAMEPVIMKIPLAWGFWERMEPRIAFGPRQQWSLLLSRYLPLYADNRSLPLVFKYPWRLLRDTFHLEDDGYMPVDDANLEGVTRDFEAHLAALRQRAFRLSPINHLALARLRELAEQHGFEVYMVDSPVYDRLHVSVEFQAYFRQVRQMLADFAAMSPRIHYLEGVPRVFPADRMVNADHLVHTASMEYTQRVVDAIRDGGVCGLR